MITYIRTTLGTSVALSSTSDLPRKLRTLLIAVDGRTGSAAFERNLSSFGDVLGLLESLRAAGYIEPINVDVAASRPSAELSKSLPSSLKTDQGLGELLYQEQLRSSSPVTPAYQPSSGAGYAKGDESARVASDQLKAAVTLMCDFVAQHLPSHALEIALELERLPSVEAVIQSLNGYEHLLKGTGEAGQRHMRELHGVLTPS